ncbi:MAG: class I SAM-dependent methyltransferase [Candidatus Binatia bacterium]
MDIDFGKTAQDYARYRAGFPDELFTRLADRGIGAAGQRVLDLGTGTGTLGRGFARRGCSVTGLDPSESLLAQAKPLDREVGVSTKYVVAKAEQTGLPDASFDVVTAGQCWHWFDRLKAAQEVRRLLVPHGWLVIAHFDWISLPANVVEATEKLIEQHNSEWKLGGGRGMYPRWLTDVAIAGFQNIETFSFDVFTPYSHEAWRGRIRASAGVAASLSSEQVTHFDTALKQLLQERFPTDPLAVHHRVFAVICQTPPEALSH